MEPARRNAVWCVEVGDRVKNFPRKVDAIAWLRGLVGDDSIRSIVCRRGRGSYVFYGPGREEHVCKATIDLLRFERLDR